MVDSFLIEVKVELDLKTKWLANLRAKVIGRTGFCLVLWVGCVWDGDFVAVHDRWSQPMTVGVKPERWCLVTDRWCL